MPARISLLPDVFIYGCQFYLVLLSIWWPRCQVYLVFLNIWRPRCEFYLVFLNIWWFWCRFYRVFLYLNDNLPRVFKYMVAHIHILPSVFKHMATHMWVSPGVFKYLTALISILPGVFTSGCQFYLVFLSIWWPIYTFYLVFLSIWWPRELPDGLWRLILGYSGVWCQKASRMASGGSFWGAPGPGVKRASRWPLETHFELFWALGSKGLPDGFWRLILRRSRPWCQKSFQMAPGGSFWAIMGSGVKRPPRWPL